ncbi:DUF7683 domain-containing protein [Spirosoma litoris]
MKIQRLISWYDKGNDELIGEINVDQIPITYLRKLFNPPGKDPLLYNPYTIRQYQANRLVEWVTIDFKLDKYSYHLECFQA